MKPGIISLLLLGVALLICQGCTYPICGFAGSYPCAQSWKIKASESELTEAIQELKKENLHLQVPGDTSTILKKHSYWVFASFYYSDTREIVSTIMNTTYGNSNSSSFSLVGFYKANNFHDYKEINRNFKWKENAKQINKFKRTILNPIKEKIKQRNKSNR